MPFDHNNDGPNFGGGGSCSNCGGIGLIQTRGTPCIRPDLATPKTPVFLEWAGMEPCPVCKPLTVLCRCKKCYDSKSSVVRGLIACCCQEVIDGTGPIQFYRPVVLQTDCPYCREKIRPS